MKLFAPLFAQHPGASTIPSLHSTCSQTACSALKNSEHHVQTTALPVKTGIVILLWWGGVASRFFYSSRTLHTCNTLLCMYIYIYISVFFMYFDDLFTCVYFSLSHSPSLFLYLYIYIYMYMHKHIYTHWYTMYILFIIYISCEIYIV